MSYSYAEELPKLCTPEGSKEFIQRRDRILFRLKEGGAIRAQEAMALMGSGDSWNHIATLDRMIELGDMIECPNPSSSWTQHRVFTLKGNA